PRYAFDDAIGEGRHLDRAWNLRTKRQPHVDVGRAPLVNARQDKAPLVGRQDKVTAGTRRLRALRGGRDDVDNHISARIDDADRLVLEHHIAVATVDRGKANDGGGQG